MAEKFSKVAIGDIGTQLFHFDKTDGKFKYAIPVIAGAEFGGDTESFEAPETDLDYIPKVMGRKSLNDISYTINYTKEKYQAVRDIINGTIEHTYMEVFSDDSAMIFRGTANVPTITAGDVRQMTVTIIPSYMHWVSDIRNLDDIDKLDLSSDLFTDTKTETPEGGNPVTTPAHINIDFTSIPSGRTGYADTANPVE